MMADKAGKHSQLSVVSFDPRTKLYHVLITVDRLKEKVKKIFE